MRLLTELDPIFDEMNATGGRRSMPPEALLKSTVMKAMYSIRSERAFRERLDYDLLFKWFLDMRIDQPAFDATTFTKNRQRLLEVEVADEFFAAVGRQARLRRYVSSDHFSVDGTLLNAGRRTSRQAQRRAAIDGRTTRHAGHTISQRIRKRVEEPFGWMKTVEGGHRLRYIGRPRDRAWFKMNAAVGDLIRVTALDTQSA